MHYYTRQANTINIIPYYLHPTIEKKIAGLDVVTSFDFKKITSWNNRCIKKIKLITKYLELVTKWSIKKKIKTIFKN